MPQDTTNLIEVLLVVFGVVIAGFAIGGAVQAWRSWSDSPPNRKALGSSLTDINLSLRNNSRRRFEGGTNVMARPKLGPLWTSRGFSTSPRPGCNPKDEHRDQTP